MFFRLAAALAVVELCSGCTGGAGGPQPPRKRLEGYISKSFAVSGAGDRAALSDFLTGEAKNRLEAWSEEEFKKNFVDNKRKFHDLKIVKVKPVSDTETTVEYELTYFDQNGQFESKVSNRKLAEMTLDGAQWKIREVRNIHELVEFKDALSLP